ncbi:FAD-dependent oxidoreductase [Paracoccus sp. MBLB3053]|uniref:FAD-dependent oxidoreductase n=1 Tax=Paracoccus aurantius TaxID=3073814 RepID=A0ABU2HY11_9RHOB|nr:FAD-dependent oxidoreductase [Paracoccus sp. MBLB3053]MDS9469946.1 FAD-dependent oxidoreductase [Paracoccus sp. MBLB3053]
MSADVAIIGAGYTGLSTARYLAASGVEPVVIEASRIGWGASGRNGGVVSGKFRIGFAEMARRWDLETARRMHDLGIEAIDHVGETIEELGIKGADYRPTGSLRCAHNQVALDALRAEADWLTGTLGDQAISMLGPEEMKAETGSRDFPGGMLNRHGGVIHPLNYVLGMARALAGQGIRIYCETPVTRLGRTADGIELHTDRGVVRARQVVIATNGYSDLTPATDAVRRRLIPFRSAMIATELLDRPMLEHDRSYTETRRMMRWFRKAGGRLVYGGRGAFGKADSAAAFAALEKAMRRQFPQLAGVAVTHRWSGLVGMTMDSLPHLSRLDDRVTFSLGYNGTGVALASMIGRHAARMVLGQKTDAGLLTSEALRPVPFYEIREPAVRLVAGYYQFLDAIGR